MKKKKSGFKSKNILIVMIILCIGLMAFSATSLISLQAVRSIAGYAVVPFQEGINQVGNWFLNHNGGFQNAAALKAENEELTEKVAQLTEENTLLQEDSDELERLRELYDLDQNYSEYEKIGAEVISKDPGNWYSTFTIDKGTNDGIDVDMNVIADGGLVGIITEVGPDWATVRSIIDDSSNVSAMVASTLDTCIITGDLKLIEEGKMNFIQLEDTEDEVVVGDKLVTSNISDKFLKGILIGYISEVSYDSNNLTKYGYIIPVVDFKHLQEVLVITQLKETGEDK